MACPENEIKENRDIFLMEQKARVLMRMHCFDEAAQMYRALLEHNSNNPAYHNSLGVSLVLQQRPDLALWHLNKAVELKGDKSFFLANLGQAHLLLQQWDKAKDCLKRALLFCGAKEKEPIKNLLLACRPNNYNTPGFPDDLSDRKKNEFKPDIFCAPNPQNTSPKASFALEAIISNKKRLLKTISSPKPMSCSELSGKVISFYPTPIPKASFKKQSGSQKIPDFDIANIRKRYEQLNAFTLTYIKSKITEPTDHPQLKFFLETATQYGPVILKTSNPQAPMTWLPKGNKKNLHIRALFRPSKINNPKLFAKRLSQIQKSGVQVFLEYFEDKQTKDQLEKDLALLSDFGLKTELRSLQNPKSGTFVDQIDLYERDLTPHTNARNWDQTLCSELPVRNFSGIPCLAGFGFILMDAKGDIYRCQQDKRPLTEPFNIAKACQSSHCKENLLLEELNILGPLVWNYWLKKAEKNFSTKKEKDNASKLMEARAKYFELMTRYDKFANMNRVSN